MTVDVQVLRSGSSGNCTVVAAGRTRLLVDAGIGPRVLARELAVLGLAIADLDGVIYTHCHGDHLVGSTVGALAKAGVPQYMNDGTWEAARGRMTPEVRAKALFRPFDTERSFEVGEVGISSFRVPHGHPGPDNAAGDPVGFALEQGEVRVGYCTDLGHVTPAITAGLVGCDFVVLESNHDPGMARVAPRPWHVKQWILGEHGHLSNDQAAELLLALCAGRETAVMLAHLSDVANTPRMAAAVCGALLADRASVAWDVAKRHQPSRPWRVNRGAARLGDPARDMRRTPLVFPGFLPAPERV